MTAKPDMTEDEASVLAVNRSFYEAFEAHDLDAMSDLWEHSDRASCVHPGWTVLRGWAAVGAGWMAIFQGPREQQFLLADEHVVVVGDAAWVTVDENILSDQQPATTVAALNLFIREPGGDWHLVAHHASPVTAAPELGEMD
jgi:ketosteroid isomerase-like protein